MFALKPGRIRSAKIINECGSRLRHNTHIHLWGASGRDSIFPLSNLERRSGGRTRWADSISAAPARAEGGQETAGSSRSRPSRLAGAKKLRVLCASAAKENSNISPPRHGGHGAATLHTRKSIAPAWLAEAKNKWISCPAARFE